VRADTERGRPLVGREPSWLSVFRDEMVNLLPGDEDARRLRDQSFLLSEYLERLKWQPPRFARKALVHGHCHHKALVKMKSEEAQLAKLGLDYQLLDSGCCGMAGAFGFERHHYEVQIKYGERLAFPAGRKSLNDTLLTPGGLRWRVQTAQTPGRRPPHLPAVMLLAPRA